MVLATVPDDVGDGRSTTELVVRARAGDRAALGDLYSSFVDVAHRVASSVLGPGQDAEDVVQEAFIRVFARLDSIRDPSAFKPYLLSAVRNAAITIWNDRRCLPVDPWDLPESSASAVDPVVAAPAPAPGEYVELEDAVGAARDALAALGSRDATALCLAEAGELDGHDLAQALGASDRSHAYVIVHRARCRFTTAVGAALLVRNGRKCAVLKHELGESAAFTVGTLKCVERHIKTCDTCRHRRALLMDHPEMAHALEGVPPTVAQVAGLRGRVLATRRPWRAIGVMLAGVVIVGSFGIGLAAGEAQRSVPVPVAAVAEAPPAHPVDLPDTTVTASPVEVDAPAPATRDGEPRGRPAGEAPPAQESVDGVDLPDTPAPVACEEQWHSGCPTAQLVKPPTPPPPPPPPLPCKVKWHPGCPKLDGPISEGPI